MSSPRNLCSAASGPIFALLSLAAPAQAAAVPAFGLTSGRFLGALGALVSLVCLVLATRALRNVTASSGAARVRDATTPLLGGAVGAALGVWVVVNADRGLGSGQGLAGGLVSVLVGLTSIVVAAVARRRGAR